MANNTIVIVREFNAPRQRVWDAWVKPEQVAQWWGPEGFTTRVEKSEVHPGGTWHYVMIDADGTEYPAEGVIKEVIDQEKIVTTDGFGKDYEAKNPDLPKGLVLTAVFEDQGDKTRLTLTVEHPTAEDKVKHLKMGMVEGWNSSLDCLAKFLADGSLA